MFVKPFRTKTNVAIKGSDRKRLRSDLAKLIGEGISSENLSELVPNKEEMTVMKLYSHKGENILVYCLKKSPIVFEHEHILYPTVYTAWRFPTLLPCFTTQPPVFERLFAGADLMLPGIIIPSSGLPKVQKGQVVAVNVLGNKAPLAVGYALLSSKDMVELAGMKGKGIKIMHTFGDHLWMAGDKEQPPKIPMELGGEFPLVSENFQVEVDHFENGSESKIENENFDDSNIENVASMTLEDCQKVEENLEEEEDPRSQIEIMDELLHHCFMTALKQKLKDSELPILTSTFYRTHVLQCCPGNQFLDIKKSSYKKLSKYLKHIESTGLIQVKELSKGNDNIISVTRAHPDLRSFKPPATESTDDKEEPEANTVSSFGIVTQKQYEPPEISVIHCVSAVTVPLFSELGYKKGSPMTLSEIRENITKYIRQHDLTKVSNPRMVTLDPLLHRAMYDKGGHNILEATWEDIFKKVISKLQACHQLKFKGMAPIIRTGGPPSIKLIVQQRASNKKVTIVENLESFLIEPQQFADLMRRKAQASTSISPVTSGASNKNLQQVLIQGNQVSLVESLLTGSEYKIPRKYLKGLENAPKPKKKGR
ncbi:eukaryotic translation initiation factor 2D-like [Styela clava]